MDIKIISIDFGGFKNISESHLEFEDITALVALNNYGKSNAMQGISFGINFIKSTENEKSDMMGLYSAIPIAKSIASKNFSFNLLLEISNDKSSYVVEYGYKFKWINKDKTGMKIIYENLRVKESAKNQIFSNFIKRENNQALYKSSDKGRCSNKILISDNELIINKIKAYDNLYYIDIVKAINSIKVHIDRHLDATSEYLSGILIKKGLEGLDIDSQINIPRTIFCLKKEHEKKYNVLIDAFKMLFPNITEIIVEELRSKFKGFDPKILANIPFEMPNSTYKIMVKDINLNQAIDFADMSDGAKRIFLHLTIIILADINKYSLIEIEEPENCIHPILFQSYLRVISKFKGNCKIIISSHSPYLLQYLKPINIYLGLPSENGIAKFNNLSGNLGKKIVKDASNLNMSFGEYVFNLLSGNDDDLKELNKYFAGEINYE